jgi:hypothetical protein
MNKRDEKGKNRNCEVKQSKRPHNMTKTDTNSLSSKQLKALPTLASVVNCNEACKQIGISRDCFYEWMKQPLFKAQLNKLRNDLVQDAVMQLKVNAIKAADTLIKLTDREDSPSVQRASANDILNHVVKFQELQELEDRVAILEEATKRKL